MREITASARPVRRALDCCSTGNLPERTDMKITLSTPGDEFEGNESNQGDPDCGVS